MSIRTPHSPDTHNSANLKTVEHGTAAASTPPQIAVPWIIRLRFGLAFSEFVLVVAAYTAFDVDLPLALAVSIVTFQGATNWLLARVARERGIRHIEHLVGSLFALDTLCLTSILAFTGGPSNPFSLLYLVQITFSAVILHRVWTWVIGALSTLCFGGLFWISTDVPALTIDPSTGAMSLHLLGMWFAFATAASLISYFIGKVIADARSKEQELLSMQQRLSRNERLASLVTLAAGAAHEISTPLATIAVTAREIERDARNRLGAGGIGEDASLIRAQVERCRLILDRMGAKGADTAGEVPAPVAIEDLLDRVRDRFSEELERIRVTVPAGFPSTCVLPARATIEALAALVKNALDASAQHQPVELNASRRGERVQFIVRDHGVGMSPETLERVAEPFFTTKPTGLGMGLGAFLAHAFAQHLGGSLAFESDLGNGCTATLSLPTTFDA